MILLPVKEVHGVNNLSHDLPAPSIDGIDNLFHHGPLGGVVRVDAASVLWRAEQVMNEVILKALETVFYFAAESSRMEAQALLVDISKLFSLMLVTSRLAHSHLCPLIISDLVLLVNVIP